MYVHKYEFQQWNPPREKTYNFTSPQIPPILSSNKRIDIVDVDGKGLAPLIVTIIILLIALVAVLTWNIQYKIWKRHQSYIRNFTFTSTDAYADAWRHDQEVGFWEDMDASGMMEEFELESFGGRRDDGERVSG